MRKIKKPIPRFKNESDEREFWQIRDSVDYIDYSKTNQVELELDPDIEKPVRLISIRLPRDLLNRLKAMASKRDVPYQSLIKMILAEKVEKEAA